MSMTKLPYRNCPSDWCFNISTTGYDEYRSLRCLSEMMKVSLTRESMASVGMAKPWWSGFG